MFSSLPKLADKNFVIGFLIPALLASLAFLHLMADTEPLGFVLESALEQNDWSKITLLALAIWVLAILLLLCNHGLYRVFEGYVGPFKYLGRRAEKVRRFRSLNDQVKKQYAAANATAPPAPIEVKRAYYRELRKMLGDFPPSEHLVLPTRFGNVIRAFEMYSYDVYGVDSIPAWLRLQGVIPKDFRALLDDARSRVDFSLNVTVLAGGIAILAVVRCGMNIYDIYRMHGALSDVIVLFPAVAMVAAIAGWAAYESAIAQARAWGDMVKSAFDLYLPALAEKLGYRLPATSLQRRQFWDALSSMFLYWQPVTPEEWPHALVKAKVSEANTSSSAGEEDD